MALAHPPGSSDRPFPVNIRMLPCPIWMHEIRAGTGQEDVVAVEKRTVDPVLFEVFKQGALALDEGYMPHRALDALAAAGFRTEMTDPVWLYEAYERDVLVDVIFRSKADIFLDDEEVARSVEREIDGLGYKFRIMSPEDLVIRKIFAMIEERPDWCDGISVIEGPKGRLDWHYFLRRGESDSGRVLKLPHLRRERLPTRPRLDSVLGDPPLCPTSNRAPAGRHHRSHSQRID